MARIELAPEVLDDFDRFLDHLIEFGASADAPQRIDEIIAAPDVLARSPLIGRRVRGGNRELVIGRSSRGYIALYRFLPDIDTVFVLALRSQLESDCKRGTQKSVMNGTERMVCCSILVPGKTFQQ